MAVRMTKPWTELTPASVSALSGQLGVYQLADASDSVVMIGFAGGRSLGFPRGAPLWAQRVSVAISASVNERSFSNA